MASFWNFIQLQTHNYFSDPHIPEEVTNLFQRLWGITKQHTGGKFLIVFYRVFFFTGSAQKVLSMELVPPNTLRMAVGGLPFEGRNL